MMVTKKILKSIQYPFDGIWGEIRYWQVFIVMSYEVPVLAMVFGIFIVNFILPSRET